MGETNYSAIVKGLRAVSALREVAEEDTDHRETLEAWAADAIEALQAELAQCRKDAERYRWLRDTQGEFFGDEYGFTFVYVCNFDDFKQPKRGLDSAIDAAMQGER